ncbi:MAG TPA: DUF1501 domain-containing protein, partial [Pyrinomonadaceae bacterium]|nr:DUF1501 domain-containing protein [Pyrinomonadaceae bacterium]
MEESRRDFIKKSSCALGMAALATQMEHFGLMSAMAQNTEGSSDDLGGDNYKALVLCYFDGGNDGNNMVIPNHSDATLSNYQTYFNARNTAGLALPQASLLPISVPQMGGLSYGLHPAFGPMTGSAGANNGLHELWALGKMAIVPNVGTLVRPTTKAQMGQSTHPKPYQLYSHSDQTNQAQNANARAPLFTGWGGRIADRMTLGSNPNAVIPMVTSISGTQLFTAAQSNLPLAIGQANNTGTPNLSTVLNPVGFTNTGGAQRLTAFNQIRGQEVVSTANFVKAAALITDKAMIANAALQGSQEVTVTFPNTGISLQLKQVACLIKERLDLNTNRQIFFVRMGGFDTHSDQLPAHTNLFTQFSQAVRAFYDEMGAQGMQNNVTLFTLSDFGRTLSPSGSGSAVGTDHAWGNHMFVVGGSVTGGNFYGINSTNGTPFPTMAFNGPDDADGGTGARGR